MTLQSIDEVAGGKLDFRGDVRPDDATTPDEGLLVHMQGQFEFEWEKRQEEKKKTSVSAEREDGLTIITGDLKETEDRRTWVAS